jgi:hypothetical protein
MKKGDTLNSLDVAVVLVQAMYTGNMPP